VLTLVLLAAAALLGWYLLSPSGPGTPDREAPAATPGLAPGGTGGSEDGRGDLARAIIEELRAKGQIDLGEVYERAERFRGAGLLADAYLLYFFAGRLGHGPSALALGRMYDPKTFTREVSILREPDVAQAHKWYDLAARAGDPAAKRHQADLRGRVERAASEGDAEAQRLTLQWR
jgi:TPR repeat protein